LASFALFDHATNLYNVGQQYLQQRKHQWFVQLSKQIKSYTIQY